MVFKKPSFWQRWKLARAIGKVNKMVLELSGNNPRELGRILVSYLDVLKNITTVIDKPDRRYEAWLMSYMVGSIRTNHFSCYSELEYLTSMVNDILSSNRWMDRTKFNIPSTLSARSNKIDTLSYFSYQDRLALVPATRTLSNIIEQFLEQLSTLDATQVEARAQDINIFLKALLNCINSYMLIYSVACKGIYPVDFADILASISNDIDNGN